ncbi:hypothetical protein JST97_34805 [bacterium]|nr:hypothetical protein [bacterium]
MKLWMVGLIMSLFMVGCGINSVTKAELEAVKVGDVLIYRHRLNGKSWMYGNKVTKIEGDTIFYVSSTKTATSKNMDIDTFEKDAPEESMKKSELLQYENEQGEDKKVIIEIRKP